MSSNKTMLSMADFNHAQEELLKITDRDNEMLNLKTLQKKITKELEQVTREIKDYDINVPFENDRKIHCESVISKFNSQRLSDIEFFEKMSYATRCITYINEWSGTEVAESLVYCCFDDYFGDRCNELIEFLNRTSIFQTVENILKSGFSLDEIIGVAHIQAIQPIRENCFEVDRFEYGHEDYKVGIRSGNLPEFYLNNEHYHDGMLERFNDSSNDSYAIVKCNKDSLYIYDMTEFVLNSRFYKNNFEFTIDVTPNNIYFEIVGLPELE